jgi:uroporphyrinogen-III synthase
MNGNEFEGKVIGLTRPAERVHEAIKIIKQHGGNALVAPTLELQVSNTQTLLNLCEMAGKLDWLIFTSPTGIMSIFKHCKDLKDRLNPKCQIAVIGPRTGKFLEDHGIKADMVAEDYTAEGLLEIFMGLKLKNKKIGLPRTMAARDKLPDGLKKMGADVIIAEAYRSGLPENKDKVKALITSIINEEVDAVTFTSTLTVKNLFKMVKDDNKEEFFKVLKDGKVIVAAIGPVTAKPLKEHQIPVLIPEEYTVEAMLEILMIKFKELEN